MEAENKVNETINKDKIKAELDRNKELAFNQKMDKVVDQMKIPKMPK